MKTKTEQLTTTSSVKSLNSTLTKASLSAVVIGMSVYTAFEIATSSQIDIEEIFTHHILPTLMIGVIIWAVLSFLLNSKVVTPIREIIDHLGRIGRGRLGPIEIDFTVREINELKDCVNHLTSKLKDAPDSEGASKAVDDLVKLRADLKILIDMNHLTPDHLVPIMKDLKELEGHLLSALQAGQIQSSSE